MTDPLRELLPLPAPTSIDLGRFGVMWQDEKALMDWARRCIDHALAQPPIIETRNAQGEVDGGYFAKPPDAKPMLQRIAAESGIVPPDPERYRFPTSAPPSVAQIKAKTLKEAADKLEQDDYEGQAVELPRLNGRAVMLVRRMASEHERGGTLRAAAPQPPAGKSSGPEPVAFMASVAKDFLNDCTQSKKLAEEWRQAGLCVIPLYEAPPDAIPREIHDRMIGEARAQADPFADKYHELIMEVASKYPGESRHETALRYIRQAEQRETGSTRLADEENKDG
jgi:hypothetical protein